MINGFFIGLLFMSTVYSSGAPSTKCLLCQLTSGFTPSNGYGCYDLAENLTICTCPDKQWKLNAPCRICDRENVCGEDNEPCSEDPAHFMPADRVYHFVCFCRSGFYVFGEKCPRSLSSTSPVSELSSDTTDSAKEQQTTINSMSTNVLEQETSSSSSADPSGTSPMATSTEIEQQTGIHSPTTESPCSRSRSILNAREHALVLLCMLYWLNK